MIFDHKVKYNGKYYLAGEDVPIVEVEEQKSEPEVPVEEEPEKPAAKPKRRGRTRKE